MVRKGQCSLWALPAVALPSVHCPFPGGPGEKTIPYVRGQGARVKDEVEVCILKVVACQDSNGSMFST